jgi:hypothetical protein
MNIYKFITPSDPITFKAENDKIAFVCTLILGNGKAGCVKTPKTNEEEEVNLPTIFIFDNDPEKTISDFLGFDIPTFANRNKKKIKECFASFCYGDVSDRKTYDDVLEAITDPEKLKEFKNKHEDSQRTSIPSWVKGAWKLSERF